MKRLAVLLAVLLFPAALAAQSEDTKLEELLAEEWEHSRPSTTSRPDPSAARSGAEAEGDIRRFHDAVLGAGALPLSVLETRVKEWVATEKATR